LARLLNPKAARAFYDWMMGIWAFTSVFIGDVNLDRFQKWLWGTPQEQQQIREELPRLDRTIETLFAVYQEHKDTQHDVLALKAQIGKLPALPDQGY
jgi:hypothetical protein